MRHACFASLASIALLVAAASPLACSSAHSSTGATFGAGNASDPSAGGSGGTGETAPGSSGGPMSGSGSSGSSSGGGAAGASSGASSLPPDAGNVAQDGLLTAGAWDDVLNPATYAGFVKSFPTTKTGADVRTVIQVLGDGDVPVSNARVTVFDASQTYLVAPTASDGRLLLVPSRDLVPAGAQLQVKIEPAAGQSFAPVTLAAPSDPDTWILHVPGAGPAAPPALDLAFVVDTTGSMGDELSYLQTEIDGIATHVAQAFPNVSVRFGLVVYRDVVDPYVTRTFDFATLASFEQNLNAQSADGGGDYPEQMQVALAQMNGLSWRDGNVARVAFLVADAPPHDQDIATAYGEFNKARLRGVRVYGLAGSGAAEDAEYVLRAGAQMTGARYLFLTDDSGVGDPHEVPHIPCFEVEHLNALVERAIASELSGKRVPADPNDVLRTVGNPVDDVCVDANQSKTYLW